LIDLIEWAERSTSGNTGLNLTLALDYGGRQEITEAVKMLVSEVESGILSVDDIKDDVVKSRMSSVALPDIDLLVRTGGEQRFSNFMLWDMSYAELYFTPVLWPDFSQTDFQQALEDFSARDRRFGGDTVVDIQNRVTSLADKRRSS
jgi:undecaprenyl diphosphate synthase